MKADAAPADGEPVADPLLEPPRREMRPETVRASKGWLEEEACVADAGRTRRPADAPWASPSRRPKATRRTRRAGP